MWNRDPADERPRAPRAEPEIIPPDRPDRAPPQPEQVWVRQRVFVARPGPVAFVLGLILLAALGVAVVLAFLGFALLLLPGVAVVAFVLVLAALLRGPRRF